jgi:hypothetical protein
MFQASGHSRREHSSWRSTMRTWPFDPTQARMTRVEGSEVA